MLRQGQSKLIPYKESTSMEIFCYNMSPKVLVSQDRKVDFNLLFLPVGKK